MTSNDATWPSAQPFRFNGGSTGILMIHGFGGIPAELQPLGVFLAAHGYTVHSVLLARHGRLPQALYGVRWHEWYASVEEAWRELNDRCERVVVIGFSMGGLLALHLAAQQPVAGIVTLAAAVQLAGGWRLRTLPFARYIVRWFYPLQGTDLNDPEVRASIAQKAGELDWDDPSVIQQLRASVRVPTGAIYELVRLGQRVRRDLPRITAPALVLQGQQDQIVLPASAEYLVAKLGSQDKHLRWFPQSGHQLPSDVEHEQVFETIVNWLAERLPVEVLVESDETDRRHQ